MIKSNTISAVVILTVTAFSCSLPIFTKMSGPAQTAATEKGYQARPAKVSGVLEFGDGCMAGYYQIKLQGIFDGSQVQVESQSDQTGHFSLVAPAGRYLMIVNKENCGSKQPVELEENTEHMFSVNVAQVKPSEKVGQMGGRLPASILIEPKR